MLIFISNQVFVPGLYEKTAFSISLSAFFIPEKAAGEKGELLFM